nr:hypothetical protein [Flavobacterium covae]
MSDKLSPVEYIKINSDGLRGTLKESIDIDNHTEMCDQTMKH